MKMTVQFIVSLIVIVCLVAAGSSYLLMRQERANQKNRIGETVLSTGRKFRGVDGASLGERRDKRFKKNRQSV